MSSKTVTYGTGKVICRQGEAADRLYILKSGAVGVYINNEAILPPDQKIAKKGVLVATIDTPGSPIGEGGLFLDHRTASLVAMQPGTVVEHIQLSGKSLAKVMVERPQMSISMCRSLAIRLCDIMDKVRDATIKAEAIERELERMSLEFVKILNKANELSKSSNSAIFNLIEEFYDSFAYRLGESVESRRRATCAIFNNMSKSNRSGLMTIHKGEPLCEEGNMGRTLFFVKEGEIAVQLGSKVISRIGPGEIAGEIAVLLKEKPKRIATLKALTDCRVQCIPAIEFNELCEEKPVLLVEIARMLSRRLDTTNSMILSRSQKMNETFAMLANGDNSIGSLFARLSTKLVQFDAAQDLAAKALEMASQAERVKHSLQAEQFA